jgi:hypothetical protein
VEGGADEKKEPLKNQGFEVIPSELWSLLFSEGDGTRTRNHRIDSPENSLTISGVFPLKTSVFSGIFAVLVPWYFSRNLGV